MALSADGNGSAAPSAENPDFGQAADSRQPADAGHHGESEHLEPESDEPDTSRPGRPPATSAEEIARIALLLFDERGFDDTTVDDIARAAGIGRRTFFRYFTSKNEVPWGDFDGELRRMRDWLRAAPVDQSAASVLHDAILGFNRYPADELVWHRKRMALILRTPALQAYSTLRYAAWREVIAEFVATRLGVPASDLVPQAVGYACLGGCVAAYEQWLEEDGDELTAVLDRALTMLIAGLASIE